MRLLGNAGHISEVTDEMEAGSVACCGVEQGSDVRYGQVVAGGV